MTIKDSIKSRVGSRKIDLVTIITIVLTNIVTLSGSFMAFKANEGTTEAVFVQTALNQVQKQSKEIVELRGMLLKAQIQIIELEAAVRVNIDEKDLLMEFLDTLPFPAWVKRYDYENDDFVMSILNEQYTSDFGFTSSQYIGKTDFDIHSEAQANSYKAIDKAVLNSGSPILERETITTRAGDLKDIYVYKFAIRLPDGSRAVGGVAIDRAILDNENNNNW